MGGSNPSPPNVIRIYMAYATIAQVRARAKAQLEEGSSVVLKNKDGNVVDTTAVSDAEITALLNTAAAIIDGKIGRYTTIPSDSAVAAEISILYAVAGVLTVMEDRATERVGTSRAERVQKKYLEELENAYKYPAVMAGTVSSLAYTTTADQ